MPHWIVGTGPEEQALKAQADENGADNIRFLGFQSGDKLQQLVSEALAIVVPSRWYENSPLTVMEGFAHGRPIIGANIGGIPELIETEVDGLLFQPGDASDLARQIASMTANPGLATEMGQRGRAKVERQFNESLHTSTLLDIYDREGVILMKVFVVGLRGFPNILGGIERHCENLYPLMAGDTLEIRSRDENPM